MKIMLSLSLSIFAADKSMTRDDTVAVGVDG